MKISAPVARVLVNRGINTLAEAEVFIDTEKGNLHNPFLLPDMDAAVKRIRLAVDKKEKILVYGDRDVDGITSICILIRTLRSIGADPFWYIPSDEGYGVHKMIIDRYSKLGVTLIVTVDCGITSFECADYAKELGIDFVITDHHEPAEAGIPKAVAVVDPKRMDSKYPFIDLAGCAVSFKTSEALMQSFGRYFDRDVVAIGYSGSGGYDVFALKSRNGIVTGKIRLAFNPTSAGGQLSEKEINELKEFRAFCVGAVIAAQSPEFFVQEINTTFKEGSLPELASQSIDIDGLVRGQCADEEPQANCAPVAAPDAGAEEKAYAVLNAFNRVESAGDLRMRFFRESNLDAVALGTIADIMPLVKENRLLVRKGLKQLVTTQKLGLRALIEKCGQKNKAGMLTAKSVSWNITPVLNAAGRRGKADLSAEMLLTDNAKKASELLGEIMKLNAERKELQAVNLEKFMPMLESQCDLEKDKIFVVTAEGIEHGVTGIIASQIMRQYRRPTVLLIIENGEAMGAARSFEEFDILSALSKLSDILLKFGGHSQAAGLTVHADKLEEFRSRLKAIGQEEIAPEHLVPSVNIDSELSASEATLGLIEELAKLEPYGMANPNPVFALKNMKIKEMTRMGANNVHLRIKLTKNGGAVLNAVGWNLGYMEEELALQSFVDIAVQLEVNTWQDKSSVQLLIEDIRPSEGI